MFYFECLSQNKHCLVLFLGQYDESSRSSLPSEIQEAYEKNLTPDLVILLTPGYLDSEISTLLSDDGFCIDMSRQKNSEVIILSFDGQCKLTVKADISTNLCLDKLALDIIRSGCSELIKGREKDVLVKAPSGTVFSKPSGKDKEEFIYASQLARHSSEFQFLAMGLLKYAPSLDKIRCIHIDTASIAAIAEALTYYISRFRGGRCKNVTYKSYSSYSGMEECKPSDLDGAWVIVSASASTNMGKDIVKIWNVRPDQVITVVSYQPVLENNSENIGNSVLFCVDDFSRRDDESYSPVKVQVQGESFSVEVSSPDQVVLKKPHKPAYIDKAIYPYREAGVFKSNKDGCPVFVNHQFLRSSNKSNDSEMSGEYRDWIKQVVRWSIPKALSTIVCCDSDKLFLNDFISVLTDCGFDSIAVCDPEDHVCMGQIDDGAVLVLSPVISSGYCFIDVNRALRLAGHKGMRVFATSYTTAASKDKFTTFRNSLIQGANGFDYAFFSFQKSYIGEKQNSSWVKEKEYLKKLINKAGDDGLDKPGVKFWLDRQNLLQQTGGGLGGEIGFSSLCKGKKLELSPGWVFWLTEYDEKKVDAESVYATVCTVLQNARENIVAGKKLSSNIYKHSVIAPENFVRFNDSLLQSCIWRAATPSELDYRSSDIISTDFQRILSKMIAACSSPKGEACLDLLMAIAIRWIKLSDRALGKLIQDAEIYLKEPHQRLLIEYIKDDFKVLSRQEELSGRPS